MEHTLQSAYEKAAAVEDVARGHHYEAETSTESFWRKAAAALPPQIRWRYAGLFEAAEQYEPILSFIVDRCRGVSERPARKPGAAPAHGHTARSARA